MMPYNGAWGDAITELPEICILEMSNLKAEFDGLPYGLMNPLSFGCKLIWDNLPEGMQTALETGYDEGTVTGDYAKYRRNTWYLWIDKGSGTYDLEFCGVEDNVESLELEPLETGLYSYNVDLVDVAYYWLKTIPASVFFAKIAALNLSESKLFRAGRECWQVRLKQSGGVYEQKQEFWKLDAFANFLAVGNLFRAFNLTSDNFNKCLIRGYSSTAFDFGNDLENLMTHAAEFYRVNSVENTPRAANTTPLTKTQLFSCAEIYINGRYYGRPIGGTLSPSDKYGLASANESAYDVLRAIAEQSGVRVGYRFAYNSSGSTFGLGVKFDVKLITQSRDGAATSDTADVTLNLANASNYSKITKRGDNILKAEVQFDTSSDKDATQIIKIKEGARASRSLNVKLRLINMPVDIGDKNKDDVWPCIKAPMKQTNMLYVRGSDFYGLPGNEFIKVHEKMRINYGANGSGGYEYVQVDADGLDYPVYPQKLKTDTTAQAQYILQINDCQVNGGLTAALCELFLKVFSNENNAIVEVEWPATLSPKIMPSYITGRHELTGKAADVFTQISWDRAMPVSLDVSFMDNKVKAKYYIVSA